MEFEHLLKHGRDIRVHPNGFIQIDMPGDQRVHVWTNRLPNRPTSPHPIHNHSFSLVSHILIGRITNFTVTGLRTDPDPLPENHFYRWGAKPDEKQNTSLHKLSDQAVVPRGWEERTYSAGEEYFMAWHEFHLSEPEINWPDYPICSLGTPPSLTDTVTIIQKVNLAPYPRCEVLIPAGVEPITEFNRYQWDAGLLWEIVQAVFDANGDS